MGCVLEKGGMPMNRRSFFGVLASVAAFLAVPWQKAGAKPTLTYRGVGFRVGHYERRFEYQGDGHVVLKCVGSATITSANPTEGTIAFANWLRSTLPEGHFRKTWDVVLSNRREVSFSTADQPRPDWAWESD